MEFDWDILFILIVDLFIVGRVCVVFGLLVVDISYLLGVGAYGISTLDVLRSFKLNLDTKFLTRLELFLFGDVALFFSPNLESVILVCIWIVASLSIFGICFIGSIYVFGIGMFWIYSLL